MAERPSSPNGETDGSRSLYCGVDIGASATKLVLIRAPSPDADRGSETVARAVLPSGVDYAGTAHRCLTAALEAAGAAPTDIVRTVSTGYGRNNVDFAQGSATEIHCHGVGGFHFHPHAMTVVDIGGQDNKVIRISSVGQRADFRMNRKCAAGTGAFIEEIALRLGLPLEELDVLAASTAHAVKLSSFCTVFAKTEILAHLRAGEPVARIVRGAFQSVVARVLEMAPLDGDVLLTGGVVAHNPSIAAILSERIGREVLVPPHPQFVGALGAALLARRQAGRPETRSS